MAYNYNNNINRSPKEKLQSSSTSTLTCNIIPSNNPCQDFKLGVTQLLPTFYGLENENPYIQLREFEEVVASFQGIPKSLDTVSLKVFLFSLKDKANT